jgi:hypothetical protein
MYGSWDGPFHSCTVQSICTYTFAPFLPETQQSMINRRDYRCRWSRLVFQAQYPSVTYWYMNEWSVSTSFGEYSTYSTTGPTVDYV